MDATGPHLASAYEEALSTGERRGLRRCRNALEKGRRVRGRIVASGHHGLLVDLRGVPGHVPTAEVSARRASRLPWAGADERWDGWVVAVGDDLVHLSPRRPEERFAEARVRSGEVVTTGRAGARIRIEGAGSLAIMPWEELSWQPMLEPPRLEPGTVLTGRIDDITLEGPILSPRSLVPTPWPAIALALPPGTRVGATVEHRAGGQALLRTDRAPRAATIVPVDRLPRDAAPGATVEATVEEVNALAGLLVLGELSLRSPSSRALRPVAADETPGRPEPGRAASDSCS
jgi:hypothetical protein